MDTSGCLVDISGYIWLHIRGLGTCLLVWKDPARTQKNT